MQVQDQLSTFKDWLQKQPKVFKQGMAGFLAVVLLCGIVSMVKTSAACAVELDGKVVAVVKNKEMAQSVVNELMKEQQKNAITVKPEQTITYKTSRSHNEVVSKEQLQKLLADRLTFEATAAGIKVRGGLKLAVKDKATAEKVLEKLKQSYSMGSDYKVSFKEPVQIEEVSLASNKILSEETAIKRLKGESDVPRYYTVKEGDTLWDIANFFKVSPEELQEANPGFTPETMQIDQKIKMVGALEPVVNVVATAETTVKEETVLPQQVKKNPKLPFGQSKVIQVGERGLKEVTYQIIAVNGMETERKVLNAKVLKEAKAQIVERSAQTMVASRGVRPGGAVLSPFGTRNGRMHTGVDLARAYGSVVGSYNSGKVVRAGWYGAYGNCVDVNHGNGVVTRYAHLSSIGVSVGQTVEKGQAIGKVGSTGRSTGPHLHFEVIVNGTPRNPLNYI
ncbi:M23 family metallopeptidase [Desulforamulus aeronauticus]|uniref:Murein DD-endopeptidase MepM and murein hydrolase activator NlpD, contain LysM domain n=1 Tax=Desulforamulus aeronauticus DSM 10349 TaxID=1121421 RepID=A0A1M6TBX3_9FIRM|nr:M23 family metallopeptidase [Desulforamulus aeronauticus]SHK54374.1 Murein DD-endopeptidase MepM and murein hydrolase activator NlpD, contain LysM domain [Desulforamulus aeronauticus DSM 10349]